METQGHEPDLVILLHGTFAGTPAPDGTEPRWWQDGSVFRRALCEACPDAEVAAFRWGKGGANSETMRQQGARELLEELRALDAKGRSYHLVAHSHGGSVAWQALVYACAARRGGQPPLRGLKSWTTIGTPFQDFAPAHLELAGAIVAALFCVAWLVVFAVAWGTLPIEGNDLGIVLRHAAPLAFPAPGAVMARLGSLTMADLARFVLSVPIAMVIVAGFLGGAGLVQRLASRAPVAAPAAQGTRVAAAAAAATVVLSFAVWLLGGQAIDFAALVMATLGSLLLAGFTILFGIDLARGWWRAHQRAAEIEAAETYGALWQPVHHPDDEAIAALRCALLPAPAIVPRPPPRNGTQPNRLIAAPLETLRLIADQFVWETAMTGLQGDDIAGAHVRSSGPAPRVLADRWRQARRVLGTGILDGANERGSVLLAQLRGWLSEAYRSRDIDKAVHRLSQTLTFDAIVHNSYFTEQAPGGSGVVARREILDLVVAAIRPASAAPVERPAVGSEEPNASRRRRHMLLHWTRVCAADAACAAVFIACFVGYASLVRPLRTERQYAEIATLPAQKGALATSDSPVVGAFLARLATSGSMAAEAAEAATRLAEPNARAVAAQRLAFLDGLSGRRRPPAPGAAQVAEADGATLDEEGEKRLQALAELSWLGGRAAAGLEVSREDADRASFLWASLRCSDTDADAAARLAIQAAAAAGAADLVSSVAAAASRIRDGACETRAQADLPWQSALKTDSAYDVLTWEDYPESTPAQREARRNTAVRLLKAVEADGRPADTILAADAEMASSTCRIEAATLVTFLRSAGAAGSCGKATGEAAAAVEASLSNGAYSAIAEGPLGGVVGAIRKACRSETFRAAGAFEQRAAAAFAACGASVEARRRLVRAAVVQLAAGQPASLAPRMKAMAADLPATVRSAGDGVLWPVIDVYRRAKRGGGGPAPELRDLAQTVAGAQERLAGGCDGPAGPCGGKIRTEHLWTAVAMLLDVEPARAAPLVDRAAERNTPACDPDGPPPDRDTAASWLQIAKSADLAGRGHVRDRFADLLTCGPLQARCPPAVVRWSPDQMLTLADLVRRRPAALDRIRQCLDHRIEEETSATERAWEIQRLANTFLLEGDLYGARTAAVRAGAVNYVLAGLCPILEARPASGGPGRGREGNWPQPVPVTFRSLQRFTYDNDRPQPLQCRGWRTFDLE